jgi:hypothetical protein
VGLRPILARACCELPHAHGDTATSGSDVTLSLSGDEALVLFEWITVFTERDDVSFNDQAERFVLLRLEGMLEKELWSRSARTMPCSWPQHASVRNPRD